MRSRSLFVISIIALISCKDVLDDCGCLEKSIERYKSTNSIEEYEAVIYTRDEEHPECIAMLDDLRDLNDCHELLMMYLHVQLEKEVEFGYRDSASIKLEIEEKIQLIPSPTDTAQGVSKAAAAVVDSAGLENVTGIIE